MLSPVMFSVYLDDLVEYLANSGVGCHCGCLFAGAVAYADDIVLLAPCPSALRIMLQFVINMLKIMVCHLMLIKLCLSVFILVRHVHALLVLSSIILKFQE